MFLTITDKNLYNIYLIHTIPHYLIDTINKVYSTDPTEGKIMIPGTYLSEKEKIEQEIQRLKDDARALVERHRGPALESILRAMNEYDISPEDVTTAYRNANKSSRRNANKQTVPPKYRDPASGKTWTGRGRTPRWLTAAEEQGRSRDEFLIK